MFPFTRKNLFPAATSQFAQTLRPLVVEANTNLVRIEESEGLTLGFGLKMEPLLFPTPEMEERVAEALGVLPTGALVQFSVLSTPQVKPVLDAWLTARIGQASPVLKDLAQSRYRMMLDSAAGRSLIPKQTLMPCVRHHFAFVQIPGDVRRYSPLEREAFARIVLGVQEHFVHALRVAGIRTTVLKAANYHALWTELLNQQCTVRDRLDHIDRGRAAISSEGVYPVLPNAVMDETEVSRGPVAGLFFKNGTREMAVAALTVSGHRRFFVGPRTSNGYPRMVSGMHLSTVTGHPFSHADRISVPYWAYTNIEILEQRDANRALFGRTGNVPRENVRKKFPFQSPERENKCQIALAQEKGYKFARVSTGMNLYAPPGELLYEVRHAENLWHRAGFQVTLHPRTEDPVVESSWPFQMTSLKGAPWRSRMHAELMSTYNAAAFTFIQGSSPGLEPTQGGALMVDRRGQVATFTPWSPTHLNHNFVISGLPDSGRHFFALELVADTLSGGGCALVLSHRAGLSKPCHALGGREVEVSAQKPVSLNPFTGLDLNQRFHEAEHLVLWLLERLYPEVDARRLSASTFRVLSTAIGDVLRVQGNEASLRDVYRWLEVHTDEWDGPELLSRLEPFVTGPYARWFEGPCEGEPDNALIFVNLDEIVQEDKVLAGHLTASLLHLASRRAFRFDNRGRRNLMLIEGSLLQMGARSGMLVEKILNRAPHCNASVGLILDQIDDGNPHPVEQLMYEKSANHVYTRQARPLERLALHERDVVQALRDGPGYSELYIREADQHGQGQGLYRFVPDDLTRELFSSDEVPPVPAEPESGVR